MKPRNFFSKTTIGVLLVICIAAAASQADAELKINSVYPTMGIKGKDLPVRISGSGFDANTRVSMALDIGNKLSIKSVDNKDIPDISFGDPLISIAKNRAYRINDDDIEVLDLNTLSVIGSVNDLREIIKWERCSSYGGAGCGVVTVIDDIAYVVDFCIYYAFGNYLYQNIIYLVDISSLSNPMLLGNLNLEGEIITPSPSIDRVNDIKVSGNKAYIACGSSGLAIVDIANPLTPKKISSVDTPGYARGLAVVDDRVYVADGISGLQVIDISDLSKPQIIASADTPGEAYGVVISGNTAYVMDDTGLQIIDIDKLSKINMISFISPPNKPTDVAVIGEYIYLLYGAFKVIREDQFSGLKVIDVSIPSNPIEVYYKSIPKYPKGLKLIKDIAVISFENTFTDDYYYAENIEGISYRGFTILNINDMANPKLIAQIRTDEGGFYYNNKPVIIGNIAYVADYDPFTGESIFQIQYISDPSSPVAITDLSSSFVLSTLYINGFPRKVIVINNIAYIITGDIHRIILNMIDVSNSNNPIPIDTVYNCDTYTYYCQQEYPVTITENTEYKITDGVFKASDISNPSSPVLIAEMKTPLPIIGGTVSGNIAYIIDATGMMVLPVPVEVKPVTPKSDTSIALSLPSPQIPGNYTIRVFNNNGEASELPGAITFVPPEDSYLLDTKAIIIAGDKSGNNIRTETQTTADFAYQTLLFQGYTAESVNYLSFDTSQPGVDAKASLAAVSYAVNNWSIRDPKATELLIYIIGHGEHGYFIINDNERLTAEQLDQWLDNLQNAYDIPVTVIYEACYSGTFLPKLTPPAGKKRDVISSASSELAYFPNSVISFSYQFWNAVYQGNEIGKSFRMAANQMKTYQTALIDADGDGIGTEAEIALAENMKIRRNYKPMTDVPYIYKVSDPRVLHDQTSAKITAGVSYIQDGTKVQRVWATIVPPDFKPDGPVTDLPEIELTDPDGDGVYEKIYDEFKVNGTYNIKVCAMNQKGMFALFRDTTVARETGYIANVSQPQVISQNSAKIWAALKPDIPVSRVWAKIQPPISGVPPTEIGLSDPEHDGIYEAVFNGFSAEGTYAAELYATDTQGYTSPAVPTTISYSSGSGRDNYEQDNTPESARYLSAGQVQTHNLHIAGDTDWIKILPQKGITYNIITSNQNLVRTSVDFYKQVVPGDVNADNKVDLKDVIAALQIVTGLGTSANIFSDVNKDGKIGLEEIVYALRDVSGLNPKTGLKLALLKTSDSAFDWTFSEGGFYYLNVRNTTPDVFGQNVKYDITVSRPIAGSTGTVRGTVKSSSGEPISEAEIFTDSGGSDLSRDNGAFSITDSVGKRIITIQADGYKEYRTAVTLAETEEQVLNIVLVPVK